MVKNIWRLKMRIFKKNNWWNTVSSIILISFIVILCILIYTPCDHKNESIDALVTSQRELMSMNEIENMKIFTPTRQFVESNIIQSTQTAPMPSQDCGYCCSIDRKNSLVFKTPKRDKAFLTIGIPTVKRKGGSYLVDTIKSLIAAMNDSEKNDVIIVVFLADFSQSDKDEIATDLMKKFEEIIKNGLLQIIQAPKSFYPDEEIKRLTYGQSQTYVKWRSKQSYDFAYMFKYSINMSTYYMQIEDDVETRTRFLPRVKKYIITETNWICLEFSELGFIGKLYRTEDLERLAIMFMMFYKEQPVDVTFLLYNNLMVQYGRRIQIPTLFQHNGLYSSLTGKLQRLKDTYFINATKAIKGDNPSADIRTTMSVYMSFLPRLAYEKTEGCFWSHGAQKAGDTFTVIFQYPHRLKRVVVITGDSNHPHDRIYEGKLDASLTLVNSTKEFVCTNDIQIGKFQNGVVDNSTLLEQLSFKVMCLTITVTKDNIPWVIIKEIAVFTA